MKKKAPQITPLWQFSDLYHFCNNNLEKEQIGPSLLYSTTIFQANVYHCNNKPKCNSAVNNVVSPLAAVIVVALAWMLH